MSEKHEHCWHGVQKKHLDAYQVKKQAQNKIYYQRHREEILKQKNKLTLTEKESFKKLVS